MMITHEDKTFNSIDYSETKLSFQEFIDCVFQNCDFSKAMLNDAVFMDCVFTDCNFSMASVENLKLKTAKFINCKLMGFDFSACNDFLFAVHFEHCTLNYASFFQKKIKNTQFLDCSMLEVDFTETDLTAVIFQNCNLLNAVFERSILEKADFRTAKNYIFDPELNKIKKAKFSYTGIAGLLNKYNIDIE